MSSPDPVAVLLGAFELPEAARVDRRVPKTLLVEHGAPTPADRRRIRDGIEELRWQFVLKPTTVAVPPFRDEESEVMEISVLVATLRSGVRASRLVELIHRAVPYPVVQIAVHGSSLTLSLAPKRRSRAQAGATVLESEPVSVDLSLGEPDELEARFRASLALSRQPRRDLRALYQGWLDALLALRSARLSGSFAVAESPEQGADRHAALRECERLDAEIARLRAAAAREKQMARRVELNLALQRAERLRAAALERLG